MPITALDPRSSTKPLTQEYYNEGATIVELVRIGSSNSIRSCELGPWQDTVVGYVHERVAAQTGRVQNCKETTSEKLTDKKGPGKSLRLPMHVEDAIYMGSSVDFERIAEGSSKRKKLTGDDQLAGEALKMQTDRVGSACNGSDVGFGEVALPALSKSGGRKHGSSGASTSEFASPLPAALAQGSSTPSPNGPNSNQKPTKATRAWDVATQRLKLQNEMQEKGVKQSRRGRRKC